MVKAVIDTNVIISGLLTKGNPRKIWHAFKEFKFKLVLSPLLFEEIISVLSRPKFDKSISALDRKETALLLELFSDFVIPKESVSACRDPGDNHVLACAIESRAEFIVTGDKDLLSLNPFRGISIVSPKAFIEFLENA